MSEIHALLAWCSVLVFVLRGLAFRFGAKWSLDSVMRVLMFGLHLLLAVTGLSLWVLRYHNPMQEGWLLAKLLVLALYAACAHWAMGREEFHLPSYAAGLLCLAYMVAASIARSPWLGLF